MRRNIGTAHEHDDIMYPSTLPFILIHLSCVAAFWSGITWQAVGICITLYWLRMFGIGAGYHRYFSHRSYSTGRLFQFALAFLAQSSAQKSVLWWAAKHRHHHLHSDTQQDVHSPGHKGFLYSHVGWVFSRKHDATDLVKVADLTSFPELRWLHKLEVMPAAVLAVLCFLIAGWSGLVVGFLWSTVLVYHATFCINSLAHVHGRKRYVTGDDSRNNWLLAFFTLGEGWHNNHHAYQSSVRQGFRWWEIDLTFYALKALSMVGIVWGLRSPPAEVLRNEQRLGSRVVNRAAEQLVARFNPERIAVTVSSALLVRAIGLARRTRPSPISNCGGAGIVAKQDAFAGRGAGARPSHVCPHSIARRNRRSSSPTPIQSGRLTANCIGSIVGSTTVAPGTIPRYRQFVGFDDRHRITLSFHHCWYYDWKLLLAALRQELRDLTAAGESRAHAG